jgi:SpoVK/Ycf46/Vps4 family AAA+-type ATPase
VDIDEIEPIEFEVNIMRKLVLAEDQKEILLGAMKSIGSEKNEWGRSYDSQEPTIILLHGGPGSGKTVTTKYVAEHFQRPLISFSAGALGQTPSTVDANLHLFLECAERWRAVLVMENADVILEQRMTGSMVHNSVVMTFQRALENYTGVIILTTTRVGALDESIEARIQVAIEYRDLIRKGRRRIWKDIIEEASKSHRVNTRDLMNHLPDLVDKPMNGKEILSAFKIAMQSVEDGDKLEWDHLAKSFRLAENFKSYLNKVRGGTGARQAALKQERALVDETRGTIGKREKKDSDEQGKSSSEDETDEEKDISVS